MFMIKKNTGNATDENTITIRDAELPSTVTVWDASVFDGNKHLVSITIDVNSVQVWGPQGEELAHWYRNQSSVAS
jgi:hypothetical protein